ncbi:hypothetical protein BKA70DRAFT_1394424 [Coprinopsis sp. MPI-PUGE-AT-0042]|nr:hypothetical protein BKA70DRAFT_1394424 [Coprinopsis sp. MPI-PUGE-AT-0042]
MTHQSQFGVAIASAQGNSFGNKQECPTCRKPGNEDHIRANFVMEEAISAWNESRPHILGIIKREQEALEAVTTRQKPRKRKRVDSRSSSPIELLDESSSAGPSTPRPKSSVSSSQPADLITIPSSDVEEDELEPKANSVVPCPMCQTQIRYKDVNEHMDRGCKDPAKPKSSSSSAWSKLMTNPSSKQKGKQKKSSDTDDEEDRIPKASYATLKEKAIKDMLKEHGLSTLGSRSQLEARHQHWVMIYNSNLDRSKRNRKTKPELRQDLKKWEESAAKRKKVTINPVEHEKAHSSEFAKLIASARSSSKAKPSNNIPSSISPEPLSPGKEPHPEVCVDTTAKEESSGNPPETIEID